jgi:hypothetical protein
MQQSAHASPRQCESTRRRQAACRGSPLSSVAYRLASSSSSSPTLLLRRSRRLLIRAIAGGERPPTTGAATGAEARVPRSGPPRRPSPVSSALDVRTRKFSHLATTRPINPSPRRSARWARVRRPAGRRAENLWEGLVVAPKPRGTSRAHLASVADSVASPLLRESWRVVALSFPRW